MWGTGREGEEGRDARILRDEHTPASLCWCAALIGASPAARGYAPLHPVQDVFAGQVAQFLCAHSRFSFT